jgi:hypothetical protein
MVTRQQSLCRPFRGRGIESLVASRFRPAEKPYYRARTGILADEVSSYWGLPLLGCVVNTNETGLASMTKNPGDDFDGKGRAKLGAVYCPTGASSPRYLSRF